MAFVNHTYQLPDLPYDYDALEPYIDATTMRVHHQRHHQGYVDGLNDTLEALADAAAHGTYDDMQSLQRDLAFHACGHINHTLFWRNLCPSDDNRHRVPPSLETVMLRQFGSWDRIYDMLIETGLAVEGGGWVMLGWEPLAGQCLFQSVEHHQHQHITNLKPLLMIDVWEHAYYLRYQNRRREYLEACWHVVDWHTVFQRLQQAWS